MGGGLLMKLVLISPLVLYAMSIVCCSSMQLNHERIRGNNETDRLALLAIKAQIQHDPHRVTSSWNETLHFCMWYGVTCSQQHRLQRVTKLELGSLKLAGSISPHMGNLSFLRVLNLENNSFTHQIPPQIGHLQRLKVMLLNNNSLTGTIPTNISSCFKLITLRLDRNNLRDKIPAELNSLSKLRTLIIQYNQLTGELPPSLGNLSSLKELDTTANNLEGSIPSSLCQLKRLTVFHLGVNRLSGVIPSCIYNLSGIVSLVMLGNQIQGSLPSNLSNAFANLEDFSMSDNLLTGAIPGSISNAVSLVSFRCSQNKLSGQVPNLQKLHNIRIFTVAKNNLGSGKDGDLSFVSELINATQLTWLGFRNNNFGGVLPTSISNLSTNLRLIGAGDNKLHGSIPTGLGNLFKLEVLQLLGNSFTGSIPNDIGTVSGLGRLFLNKNQLSGSIPYSLGNLSLLTILQLQENNLEGSIPSSLGKYPWLLELILSGNNLNGTIPAQIFSLSSLSKNLALDRNQLTGSLPMEIGELKNLGSLDVSNNLLSGELPSSLGNCKSLEFLHLQGNFFLGYIPSSMKELRGILDLDLSRNNLSGDIPQFLQSFGNLENLNLSFNQLSGAVPTGGVFKNASVISVAGNARLCGGIANLRLPVCKSNGGGLSHIMTLMISLVSGFTLFGVAMVLLILHLHKKRKESESNTTYGDFFLQVSYASLLKATNGFSSANLIGEGAFGSLYKGILADDGVVAVKVLNMLHWGASKSFMAECEALRNIRHRNLVKILTVCSSTDFSSIDFKALVYEFMENGSLEDWLHPSTGNEELTKAPKSLSLVQRLNIAIDIACALDYLHNYCETPIVHCDLKPSNVLLDRDLTGHVSDFGLARFLPQSINVSRNQSSSIGIRGSVGYAAPEYGMGSKASTHGDVYSFGILVLEIFTGKRPTHYMFSDGLNLHNYVKAALPTRVADVADPLVLQGGSDDVVRLKTALPKPVADIADPLFLQGGHINIEKSQHLSSMREQKIEGCLTPIFEIGIACSVESPTNRMEISDAAYKLHTIRDYLLH